MIVVYSFFMLLCFLTGKKDTLSMRNCFENAVRPVLVIECFNFIK